MSDAVPTILLVLVTILCERCPTSRYLTGYVSILTKIHPSPASRRLHDQWLWR